MNFREEAEQAARQQAAEKAAADREKQAERAAARTLAKDFVKYAEEEGFKPLKIYREVSFRQPIIWHGSKRYELFGRGFLVRFNDDRFTVSTSGSFYGSGDIRGSKSEYKNDFSRKYRLPRKGVIYGDFREQDTYYVTGYVETLRKLAQAIASGQVRPTEPGAIGF